MKKQAFSSREQQIEPQAFRRKSIIAFSVLVIMLAIGATAFYFLFNEPKGTDSVQPTLRSVMVANESLFTRIFSVNRQVKLYKKADADEKVRVNGDVGMGDDFNPATWKLKVARKPGDTLVLTIDDIRALPKREIIFDFKCVEGWDQITHWGGVRVGDFLMKYNLTAQTAMKYMGMVTPDGTYYVGIDMPSMLQPQTILCYEMNGRPLPKIQGAPLRLIIPVKYGIKHLKRIGTIFFSNTKPRDYWAEQGYDYYAGL